MYLENPLSQDHDIGHTDCIQGVDDIRHTVLVQYVDDLFNFPQHSVNI